MFCALPKNGVYQWLVHASFLWQFYLENVLWICQTSCTILWQIVFQILSGTFLHDHPIDLNHSNIPEDNKQIFSKNWLFCGLSRHLSKLVVSCCNEKVGKNGKDKHSLSSINNIFNYKGKIRFKLTFPFISYKHSE